MNVSSPLAGMILQCPDCSSLNAQLTVNMNEYSVTPHLDSVGAVIVMVMCTVVRKFEENQTAPTYQVKRDSDSMPQWSIDLSLMSPVLNCMVQFVTMTCDKSIALFQ